MLCERPLCAHEQLFVCRPFLECRSPRSADFLSASPSERLSDLSSSLPIGRITKRITQAIGEGLQLGGRPPTLRVGHIDKLLLRSHSDVDHLQAASLYVAARTKHRQKRDAKPSERRVTHHVAVV